MLDRSRRATGIARLSLAGLSSLEPVYETVRLTRAGLSDGDGADRVRRRAVDGGDLHGRGRRQPGFPPGQVLGLPRPGGFAALIDLIGDATIAYLSGQIAAGADAVQLFDSWAGVLPEAEFERWVIAPTRRIVARLKQRFPAVPVIGFPRGAGLLYERYAAETGVDAVGLDTVVPIGFARDRLQPGLPVQGNLDPVALLVGGRRWREPSRRSAGRSASGPFVFNLGHGVLPQTPPENVAELARLLGEPGRPNAELRWRAARSC